VVLTGTIQRLESQTAAKYRNPESKGITAVACRNVPTIDDLLADALIQKVMQADRVEPHALRNLLDRTAHRIADSRCGGSVQVGQDLGWRGSSRGPLLLMRPATRMMGGERGASLCD
jgi:hypothetical protein